MNTNQTTTTTTTTDVRCKGCGKSFTGVRGLRSHQSAPFQTADCRPQKHVAS